MARVRPGDARRADRRSPGDGCPGRPRDPRLVRDRGPAGNVRLGARRSAPRRAPRRRDRAGRRDLGHPAVGERRRRPDVPPTSSASFASFAGAAAERFPWVRRWIVWNEPNQRRWLLPPSPAVYVTKLLNPGGAAIKAVIPQASIAGGATAPRGGTGGTSPVDFIRGMGRAGARLDAYAHHPHPLSPAETPFTGGCSRCETISMASLDRLVDETRATFGPRTRIWLTELGYQTNPPDRILGVDVGEAGAVRRRGPAARVRDEPRRPVDPVPRARRAEARGLAERARDRVRHREAGDGLVLAPARAGLPHRGWRPRCGGRSGRGRVLRAYLLQRRVGGRWVGVGGSGRTNGRGFFTRTIRADTGHAAPPLRPGIAPVEPDARRHLSRAVSPGRPVV